MPGDLVIGYVDGTFGIWISWSSQLGSHAIHFHDFLYLNSFSLGYRERPTSTLPARSLKSPLKSLHFGDLFPGAGRCAMNPEKA